MENELTTHTKKGHNANLLLAVSGPLESFLEWLTANYDYVDGDWYYKTDLDGDNPLSHSNILFCYQAACASGAVDKTVSGGKKLCECYDPFPDSDNVCRNCNGSTIRV